MGRVGIREEEEAGSGGATLHRPSLIPRDEGARAGVTGLPAALAPHCDLEWGRAGVPSQGRAATKNCLPVDAYALGVRGDDYR